MSLLHIPKDAAQALRSFAKYSRDDAQALVEAIRKASPALLLSDLAESIAGSTRLSVQEVESLLEAFAGMHLTRIHSEKSVGDFVADVVFALQENADGDSVQAGGWENLANDVSAVLSCESLEVTAKAIDVMTEHEHVFQRARIVTDIRPIFSADIDQQPRAAVLIHMLNLFYRENGEMKQIGLALDDADLNLLKESIERAAVKAKTLKTSLGVEFLESR